jgi:hypothetical protein
MIDGKANIPRTFKHCFRIRRGSMQRLAKSHASATSAHVVLDTRVVAVDVFHVHDYVPVTRKVPGLIEVGIPVAATTVRYDDQWETSPF